MAAGWAGEGRGLRYLLTCVKAGYHAACGSTALKPLKVLRYSAFRPSLFNVSIKHDQIFFATVCNRPTCVSILNYKNLH